MNFITINVRLYGSIARHAGGKHVAQLEVEVYPGTSKTGLLAQIGIPEQERGYMFINSVLCDVPGLVTERKEPLADGDQVGVFSIDRVWPYQYRDGVRMSPELREALKERGAMHHSYQETQE